MIHDAAAIMMLASQCAPSVAPQTVAAIVRTESRGHQFALNVNGGKQPAPQSNAADAAATARRYINAGYSVDLGLGQINSRNLRGLGLTLETIFEPCTNVAALGTILSANYKSVLPMAMSAKLSRAPDMSPASRLPQSPPQSTSSPPNRGQAALTCAR